MWPQPCLRAKPENFKTTETGEACNGIGFDAFVSSDPCMTTVHMCSPSFRAVTLGPAYRNLNSMAYTHHKPKPTNERPADERRTQHRLPSLHLLSPSRA